MTCGVTRSNTGAMCELEYPHQGRLHRLSNCDSRKTQEWDDEEIAVSPWNRKLDPILIEKFS